MILPKTILETLSSHAEKAYPEECCGLILKSACGPTDFRVWPVRNLQNEMHRRLPEEFPRTARSAYWMDPQELLRVHKALRRNASRICGIYHSHPDAGAFFSAEDERMALDDRGDPLYPGADYWIVPVREGRAGEARCFSWAPAHKRFQS